MITHVDSAVSKATVSRDLSLLRRTALAPWAARTGKYVLLLVLAASYALPFYWMASSALKDGAQVDTVPPVWIPNPAHWENLWKPWITYGFTQYLQNTVLNYALPVAIAATLSSTIVAYGFSRLQWKGRDLLFGVCLATMMIPFQVTMVPLFITYKHLQWINSFRPLVVPAFFGGAYFIFLLRQFFLTIPQELSEAARIDGANELDILWRILIPLAKPALAVVALFRFLWAWNDYMGPLIYLNKREFATLALGIANLRTDVYNAMGEEMAFPYLMAVSALVTLPVALLFFFAQRAFIEGISLTGTKG